MVLDEVETSINRSNQRIVMVRLELAVTDDLIWWWNKDDRRRPEDHGNDRCRPESKTAGEDDGGLHLSTATYMLRTTSCCHGCAAPDGGDQTARLEDAPQQHVLGRGGEIDRRRRRLAKGIGHTVEQSRWENKVNEEISCCLYRPTCVLQIGPAPVRNKVGLNLDSCLSRARICWRIGIEGKDMI
jgi:hypothetical protein